MAYRVTLTASTDKIVAGLNRTLRGRIANALARLADNPRPPGSVKLTGLQAYRVRVGDYRIIYEIYDGELIVLVIDVGHRREVYRR